MFGYAFLVKTGVEFLFSLKFLARDVVHRKVVHVRLDELEGLLLDHAGRLAVNHCAQLLDHLAANALPLLRSLVEGVANDLLDVVKGLDTLAQPEAEVTEPLVVESDRPVLAEEFDGVGNDAVLVPLRELVEIVLVEANEAPQTLKDNLLVPHVGDRVDQADAVEGELDEVAFARRCVKFVTDKVASVLYLLLAWLEDQRVRRLDVVVDDIVWKNTALALGQEEERQLLIKLALTSRWLIRVMDVKDAAGKTRAHLTTVVAVHAKRSSLA